MSITIEKTKYDCGSGVSSRGVQRWQQSANKPIVNNNKATNDTTYWSGNTVRASVTGPSPVRTDSSLVPPIRQTASIFKQPVTVYKSGGAAPSVPPAQIPASTTVGNTDKPKQLIWEKRLEGLRACDASGEELGAMELPRGLKPVLGPVSEGTVVQSVATALHVCQGAVTGQTGPRSQLDKNPGVYLDPRQPLVHQISITDDDIRKQEERVANARRKLQEALVS